MRSKVSILLLVIALMLGVSSIVFASSSYLSQFNTKYGTTGTVLNSCTLCHTNVPAVNNYGADFANRTIGNHTFNTTLEGRDSDVDGFTNIVEINARTFPGNASSQPAASDVTAPTVTGFSIPATASSLVVSISTFTATDTVGVTGYMVTELATAPAASATGWSGTVPASYSFATAGAKTLYAWAKDAAGNVSTSRSASVTITLPDTTAPTVTGFTIPATASSLVVSITTFTATDTVGVTGYMVTESATGPVASATGWGATVPPSYSFTTAGAKTLYAWAKDAAGNVSTSRSASVTITLPDTTAPTVTGFSIPATASSLVVSISTFTATDTVGVTGYMVTELATAPAASATGWSGTVPASYSFATAGAKTLYAWAKDAAGNVSTSRSASVTITLPDTTAPTVTGFTIPATASSLVVSITTFTATDTVGVTGYMVTESATGPVASATGWGATVPPSYSFTTAGAKTLYAWAKDAAGNVSTSRSASVTITLPPTADTTPPTVNSFTILSASSSLTVPISSFSVTDNMGVTGYMVTESVTAPAASATGWSGTVPASYSFTTAGAKTLYAWAKDAAGNVSTSRSASVTITLPPTADTTPPTVNSFTILSASSSLTVPISSFSVTDNMGVTGYMVTESTTVPSASIPGWTASPSANHTFTTAGSKTLYAWAKDAAGNVSIAPTLSAQVTITLENTPPSSETLPTSSDTPDMTIWVGKWFKVTLRNAGYYDETQGLTDERQKVVGYLKIRGWDSANKILQADLYGRNDVGEEWWVMSIPLHYILGSDLDFICWSQVVGEVTYGFTARVKGRERGGVLRSATFKTLGGYHVQVNQVGAASGLSDSQVWAGWLKMGGDSILDSKVPVEVMMIAQ